MPHWIPDQRWAGRDVYVIGGGPSLREFDFTRLRGQATLGCNASYRLGPELCNVCLFSDIPFFEKHYMGLAHFKGTVVTHNPDLRTCAESWLKYVVREDQGVHPDKIGYNTCSGAAAITLALLMGAKRVMLLGFDCKPGPEHTIKPNWYDNRIEAPSVEVFGKFEEGFRNIAQEYRNVFPDTEIINLGPDSALTVFKRRSMDLYI
jgi:hypothetical protein